MRLKMSSAKWRLVCLGLNVLKSLFVCVCWVGVDTIEWAGVYYFIQK